MTSEQGHYIETTHVDAGCVYNLLQPLLVRARPTDAFEALESHIEAGVLSERQVERIIHLLSHDGDHNSTEGMQASD